MLVDASTGEVVAQMTAENARALTESIKASSGRLYQLLLDAYEGHAWAALGYSSWGAYCRTEFDYGRQYAYRLLDQGRVIAAIESTIVEVSPDGDTFSPSVADKVTEAAARDIKPRLKAVTDDIAQSLADNPAADPGEIVTEIIAKHRTTTATATHDLGPATDDEERLDLAARVLKNAAGAHRFFRCATGDEAAELADDETRRAIERVRRAATDWFDAYDRARTPGLSVVKGDRR